MTFLEEHWDNILSDIPPGLDGANVVATAFLRPWSHDVCNIDMIAKAIKLLKPKVVLELGTWEGLGSRRIAEAMTTYDGEKKFYTFDVGDAPFNSLGPTYGVPAEQRTVNWQDFPHEGWGCFGDVIKRREENLSMNYPGVDVRFIPGITFDSLPIAMPEIGRFDFMYQDSVHDIGQLIKEWNLYKDYAKLGSVVSFDDIIEGHPFMEWFIENEPGWITKHTSLGHQQMWAEKIKGEAWEEAPIVVLVEEVLRVDEIDPNKLPKYMCLVCGRYWYTKHKMEFNKIKCPCCRDVYYGDNIIADNPEPVEPLTVFKCGKGHTFAVEFPGDVTGCVCCDEKIKGEGLTLKKWQTTELDRRGI